MRWTIVIVGTLALATIAETPLFSSQETEPWQYDTGFQPKKHGWAVQNFTLESRVGTAVDWHYVFGISGACNGMSTVAQMAFDPKNPDSRGLYDLTEKLGERNARLFAATAHAQLTWEKVKLAALNGTMEDTFDNLLANYKTSTASKQKPSEVTEKIMRDMEQTHTPQMLSLQGGGAHSILLTAYKKIGSQIRFKAYDPNAPAGPHADPPLDVYFQIDAKDEQFFIYSENRKTGKITREYLDGGRFRYTDIHQDNSYRNENVTKKFQELYQDAADGHFDGKVGKADHLGGILLTTNVKFPLGEAPKALLQHDGKVFAKMKSGEIEIEGLSPETFGILLRCVVLGEQPAGLSLGSEVSEKPGFMKVTYLGLLHNTPVGQALLEADLRLKGILLGIGLGSGGGPTPGLQSFASTFPKMTPTSFCRLWIVGSEVELATRSGKLTIHNPGLKLRSSLAFRGARVEDPELERFVEEFNAKWPEFAKAIPEFNRLEGPVLAAGLARWVAESDCAVDPDLWGYPCRSVETPDHVPSAVQLNGRGLHAGEGGIGLSGDNPPIKLGTIAGIAISNKFGLFVASGQKDWWLIPAMGLLAAGSPIIILYRRSPRISASRKRRLAGALLAWGAVLSSLTFVMVLVAELVFPFLSNFDAELLSLFLVFVLPLFTIRFFAKKCVGPGVRISAWRGFPTLALIAVSTLTVASVGLDALLIKQSNGHWSPRLAFQCQVASAPLEVLARPWVSQLFETGIVASHPASIVRSTFWRFEIEGERARLLPDSDEITSISPFGMTGPLGSVTTYERVISPGFTSREPVFTPGGKPPY